jgi:hypothetical protein
MDECNIMHTFQNYCVGGNSQKKVYTPYDFIQIEC